MGSVLQHRKIQIPLRSVGEVSEWLKEHAWKVCIRQKCIEGSNPSLSAKAIKKLAERLAFLLLERWESSL